MSAPNSADGGVIAETLCDCVGAYAPVSRNSNATATPARMRFIPATAHDRPMASVLDQNSPRIHDAEAASLERPLRDTARFSGREDQVGFSPPIVQGARNDGPLQAAPTKRLARRRPGDTHHAILHEADGCRSWMSVDVCHISHNLG